MLVLVNQTACWTDSFMIQELLIMSFIQKGNNLTCIKLSSFITQPALDSLSYELFKRAIRTEISDLV